MIFIIFFFFQAEDGIRDRDVTGVQTCALPISMAATNPQPTASQTGRRFFKRSSSEKHHLTIDSRRPETGAIELGSRTRRFSRVETVLAARDLEALGDQLGVVARAAHARSEARIVVLAA